MTFDAQAIRAIAYDSVAPGDGRYASEERSGQAASARRAVTTADLEPHRALVERFVREDASPGCTADTLIANPTGMFYSLPRFCWWLVTNNLIPGEPAPAPAPAPVAGNTLVGERLATASTPDDWRPYRDDLLRFVREGDHEWSWWGRDDDIAVRNVDVVLGFNGRPGWLNADGSGDRHPVLDLFAQALREGTFALAGDQPAVPSGDSVDERHTYAFWLGLPEGSPVFREMDVEWLRSLEPEHQRYREGASIRGNAFTQVLEQPGLYTIHIQAWFRWLVEHPAPVTTPTPEQETPTVTDTVLDRALLDQRINTWPREAREAVQHDVARFYRSENTHVTEEYALENSNHALLFESNGDSDYWRHEEWTWHRRYRERIVAGTWTPEGVTFSAVTTPEPAAASTNPEVNRFIATYNAIVPDDLTGMGGHGPGSHRVTDHFIAMPDTVKETWRALYGRADEAGRDTVNLGGVSSFDNVMRVRYGWSTSNFFAWARSIGVTTTDGTPTEVVPSGDTAPTAATLADQVRLLLDAPTYRWPADLRRAIREDVLQYEMDTRGSSRSFADGNAAWTLDDPQAGPGGYWDSREHELTTAWRAAVRVGRPLSDGSTVITPTPTPIPTEEVTTFNFDMTPEQFNADRVNLMRPHRAAGDEYIRYRGSVSPSWLRFFFYGEEDANVETWRGLTEGTYIDYARSFLEWARSHRDLFVAAPAAAPVTAEPGAVIPIGPEHPGWHDFCERVAAVATRAGMCPEYDRIARAMGMETRKERVTYRIVLDVPVDVERGNNADIRALREAAATALTTATASGARRLEQSRTQVTA